MEVVRFSMLPTSCPSGRRISWRTLEATGTGGVVFIEQLASLPEAERQVRVPTITDPRGVDFEAYRRLKQTDGMAEIEARPSARSRRLAS